MSHFSPEVESQRVAHHRHVVVRAQQHPVAPCWHAQQAHFQFFPVSIPRFHSVFLLVKCQRTVSTQFDADSTIVAFHFHMGCHFFLCIQRRICGNGDDGQIGLQVVHLCVFHLRKHAFHIEVSKVEASELCSRICWHQEGCKGQC